MFEIKCVLILLSYSSNLVLGNIPDDDDDVTAEDSLVELWAWAAAAAAFLSLMALLAALSPLPCTL